MRNSFDARLPHSDDIEIADHSGDLTELVTNGALRIDVKTVENTQPGWNQTSMARQKPPQFRMH